MGTQDEILEAMKTLDLNQSPYIKDIDKGLLKYGYFLLKKIHLNISKKQKPFLRIILADKTGHLPGIYFGHETDLTKIHNQLKEGDIVGISGVLEEYQSALQIRLIKLEKVENKNIELSRFWKRTPFSRRELYKKLKSLLNQISIKELRELCFLFLKDRPFMKIFLDAPASRFVHHAYIGGLLEHTLHVMELCESYSRVFESADKNLLLAGAFLHDIGKVDEYSFLFKIDHSFLAKFKGHTLLGYDRLQKKLDQIEIPADLRIKLEHILLSHQGKRIWGAIEEPRFLEAYLVHAADSTDSSQFIYSQARKKNVKPPSHWSEYISYLNRDIYLD